MKNISLISPIGIDLGSKYTGVYFNQYLQGEIFKQGNQRKLEVVVKGNKKTEAYLGFHLVASRALLPKRPHFPM